MNSKKIRTAGALVLAFLVLLYVGYQAYLATHRSIKTETAMYGEASDVVQAQGFIIRNETVIQGAHSGVVSYRVADGDRVAKGGVIADVYASESDAAAHRELSSLEKEIADLQALSQTANFYVANPSMLGDQIYSALDSVSLRVNANDLSDLDSAKADLQNALTRRKLVTGEEDSQDYTQRVAELESQRATLESQAGWVTDTILAPEAGYFISGVDGLEEAASVEDVEDITVEQVGQLLEKQPQETGAVGKICQDFNWYAVCVLDADDMVHFEGVEDVYLDIPFASTEQIPAKVVARNRDADSGQTAVVFQCSTMDGDLAAVRNEALQITVNTYSGVLVNEKALRFVDVETTTTDANGNEVATVHENVKGVYVLYGGQLEFVQVFTDETVNGYAICKTELSAEEREMLVTDATIQLYDQVVVEGTDLYDNKVMR